MSDRKSLILPFFLRHYLFLCLSYYLFSCFRLCLCYSLFSLSPLFPFFCFRLCLCYSLSSLSSLLPLFCFRHSATNYQVIQNAEVNNQKKQKIKFSHKEINVIWDGSLF